MTFNAIIPPPLAPGDLIGIAAPASPFDRAAFNRGVAAIEQQGYRVRIPDAVFETAGFLAGADRVRAAALNALFTDAEVGAILCARGGYGSLRILPLLDFDQIRSHPKFLAGFSDITFLLNAIYVKSAVATLHGPLVTTLDQPLNAAPLFSALAGAPQPAIRAERCLVIRGGRSSGPVVGGNLTCLCHLLGTPWQVPLRDRILVLEDRGEEPYRVDRMLAHLKLAGGLDGLAGVVLGGFDDAGGLSREMADVFRDAFADTEFPVAAGFPLGHGSRNSTVPIGCEATLDADRGELRLRLWGESD